MLLVRKDNSRWVAGQHRLRARAGRVQGPETKWTRVEWNHDGQLPSFEVGAVSTM